LRRDDYLIIYYWYETKIHHSKIFIWCKITPFQEICKIVEPKKIKNNSSNYYFALSAPIIDWN
jgi:hypothetical protein